MENDLPERYNEGIIPSPELQMEPEKLPVPAWRPAPSHVKASRKNLVRDLGILALIFLACLLIAVFALGGLS